MANSKRSRGLLLVTLLVLAAGVGVWYYLHSESDKHPEFTTIPVTRGEITQTVTATGDLQPVVTVDIGAQVSGQVQDVLVDFNSKVKSGDVLAQIDPLPAQQRLKQAQADLESAKASSKLATITADRTKELFAKNLVSQSDLDTAQAQLAQANATLMTRTAAVENAKLDVDHCTIRSPIDGIVLSRNTDKGRTVNSSMNAPVLFTLVNDLTKLQINAAVAEADVGSISEGQEVSFTVDAYPNRTFRGVVFQVRNAATTTSNVVSYATIINVANDDLKLKPGMTANVSIIIAQKNNVLRLGNAALRARIPPELLPKTPASAAAADKSAPQNRTLSEQERRVAMRSAMSEAGIQMGTPATPEQIDKFKKIAAEKGLDEEQITRIAGFMANGRGRGGGNRREGNGERSAVVTRTVYKLVGTEQKTLEPVSVRLGISDGVNTEVLSGLSEGDTVVTSAVLPESSSSSGGPRNPFQQGPRFGGPGFRGR
ncbi:MAG TPA: efflux RND transporter periplasmic adaptor subunit [Opitutaceae bacterium]|nr:efflux RND transporter periplasmic adaptor subunit [Opitutaceae bacterium]